MNGELRYLRGGPARFASDAQVEAATLRALERWRPLLDRLAPNDTPSLESATRILELIHQSPGGLMVATCECGRKFQSPIVDVDDADRFDDEVSRHRADCTAARIAVPL